jgi:hypothetical protein
MGEIKIETKFDSSMIHQRVYSLGDENTIHSIMDEVMKLRDEGVREALIALGWTPPGGVNGEE